MTNIKIYPSEDNGIIVSMTEEIGKLNRYWLNEAIGNFIRRNYKSFDIEVDKQIRAILHKKGIFIFGNTKKAVNSAFDTLKRKFNETIELEDRFNGKKFDNLRVWNDGINSIIYECGCLEMAVEIKLYHE